MPRSWDKQAQVAQRVDMTKPPRLRVTAIPNPEKQISSRKYKQKNESKKAFPSSQHLSQGPEPIRVLVHGLGHPSRTGDEQVTSRLPFLCCPLSLALYLHRNINPRTKHARKSGKRKAWRILVLPTDGKERNMT